MAQVTFKKLNFSELPQVYMDAIISWENGVLVVETSGLTQAQIDKGLEWLNANGYKLQP